MSRPVRLLFVEDNGDDYLLEVRALRRSGWEPDARQVTRLDDLRAALRECRYDCVVSDFSLCGFDAYAVIAEVRALAPGTPVIVVSGTVGEDTAVQLLKAGAIDFVTKDALPRLGRMLERALAERDATLAKATAEAAVRESESRFRTMADSAPVLIWLAREDDAFEYVNHAWLDFRGRTLADESGAGWREGLHPDDAAAWDEAFARARAAGGGFRHEIRLRDRFGDHRWMLVHGAPRRDARGYIGSAVDITEMKEMTAELRRSNAELEQFAYVASHDLQEPVRMVTMYLELLQRRSLDRFDAHERRYLAVVLEAAARIRSQIADLLAYASLGQERRPAVPTDAAAVLDESLAIFRDEIERLGAVVDRGPLPAVVVRPDDLRQLLQNLVGNALKYRGDSAPRIAIAAERAEDGACRFTVRDNGIGIDAQNHERIFDVFQRLHSRDAYPGTGIGLSVCKKIVESYGGRIWVESTLGSGSTFHFTLPAAADVAVR
ncbi:MAG: PAS domain S-box protein [Planctomycetes bacterium]|nr:PAS domain S-box protein [Planctomycetota bacterium]